MSAYVRPCPAFQPALPCWGYSETVASSIKLIYARCMLGEAPASPALGFAQGRLDELLRMISGSRLAFEICYFFICFYKMQCPDGC